MTQFSVVGFNEASGKTFLAYVDATSFPDAMRLAAQAHPNDIIVCAVPGHAKEGVGIEFTGEGLVSAETVLEQADVFC